MRKQFDLNYYIEHPETKVVTRNGNNVRIICTDAMSSEVTNKVVGLIRLVDYENVQIFYSNGLVLKYGEHCYDLFFDLPDPIKKKVPLTYEDLLKRVKAGKTMWMCIAGVAINIIGFDREYIYYLGYEAEKYFEKYKCFADLDVLFVDGDPCWKEVEE